MITFVYMKPVFCKIASIAMAFLLLLSTTSWKVEKHFCMGHLVTIAFFTDADTCGMNMVDDSEKIDATKNDCCDDEVAFIVGQNHLKLSFDDFNLNAQHFFIAFTETYANLFQPLKLQPTLSEYYPPPILVKDIQLLDQVFLI